MASYRYRVSVREGIDIGMKRSSKFASLRCFQGGCPGFLRTPPAHVVLAQVEGRYPKGAHAAACDQVVAVKSEVVYELKKAPSLNS